MDVTCTRCGTVYEFEEALISTTGTTVKCTQCGHLFKVHRPAPTSTAPPADEDEGRELRWRVRRANGSAHTLESLAELTRLITAGQFGREDEISRTGQVWKKLGDIQELASLFEPSASTRPRRPSEMSGPPPPPPPPAPEEEPARASTPPPPPAPLPAAIDASSPPRARTRSRERFQVMSPEIALDSPAAARAESGPTEAAAATTGTSARGDPTVPAIPSRMPPAAAARASAHPQPIEEDEFDAPLRAQSRIGLWLLFGIPILIGGAIAAALAIRPSPPPRLAVEQPARQFLQRGDEAFGSHLVARFDEAISEYGKALAFHPDDAHILSSISRVYAVWSDWLHYRLRALADADGSAQAEADALRAEARRLADQAKLYGERAAQRNPGNEEASVALSDALRLTSNLVAARAELDRARATEGVAPAETLRVAALLAIDEANGDYSAGRALAEQAVARDPKMVRARVLLALCLIADGDLDGARMHLEAARSGRAPHPILDEIHSEIARVERARKQPPAPAQPAAPQAKAAQAPPVHTAQPAASKRESPAAAPAEPRDPGELVRKGESALERGAVQQAERLFEQALEIDPGMPRAKTGLGYVALERSQPRQAVNHFRPAAKSGNPEALIGLGDAYRRLGRMRDALSAYKDYLERYPRGERRSIAQRQVELLSEQLADNP